MPFDVYLESESASLPEFSVVAKKPKTWLYYAIGGGAILTLIYILFFRKK